MILKSLLITAFVSFTLLAGAQKMKIKRKGVTPVDVSKKVPDNTSQYSMNQFTGRWQEVKRADLNGHPVDFKDTLFYNFSSKGEVFSYDGVNMSMKGEAAIDPGNVLIAAADVFTIRSMNSSQVVLDDGEFRHTLARKKEFWYETLPSNQVKEEKFNMPVTVNASALSGKWKVYRRAAEPGSVDKVLIRILDVQNVKNESSATGEITFYKTEKLETLPCTITLEGEKMRITTDKNTWQVNIYKADGKDLIFGDATLMYYCKPI